MPEYPEDNNELEETDAQADEGEDETSPETENPEPAPTARPLNISIPVTPVLNRTGDALWGDEQKPKPKNDLSDLFEVPHATDNDMDTSDLFDVPEEDDHDMNIDDLVDGDLSDLTQVTREDVMGRPPKPRLRKPRYSRTDRPYNPPTSMGETR